MEGRRGRVPSAPITRVTDPGPIDGRVAGARIRAIRADESGAVLRVWAASFGARYPLRADVLELSLGADPPLTAIQGSVAEADGRVVGFAFAGSCPGGTVELAALRGRAWLQAVVVAPEWRRRGLGGALVRAVVGVGRAAGATRVQAGGGLFYLWPGVPNDLPDAGPFLEAIGFVFDPDVAFDLRGDVSDLHLDAQAVAALDAARVRVVPATGADRDALLAFLLAEFGAEWWHDTGYFLDRGGDPADELLLVAPDRRIRGFARIHTVASRPPGWPMFWRTGEATAGGLGPIGVAEALRGRGLGRALLVSALDRLRALGATDVVIDDTTLMGYYGPHGFSPWITYRDAVAPIGPLLAGPAAPDREDP